MAIFGAPFVAAHDLVAPKDVSYSALHLTTAMVLELAITIHLLRLVR